MAPKIDNILLVDDDAITNFLNMDVISKLGIARNVNIVEDGNEALEFINENWMRWDQSGDKENNLIFLDINMPYMGAFQFLERFERLRCKNNISIVLLTSSDSQRDWERARHFNVSSYLTKPLTRQKIFSALQMV